MNCESSSGNADWMELGKCDRRTHLFSYLSIFCIFLRLIWLDQILLLTWISVRDTSTSKNYLSCLNETYFFIWSDIKSTHVDLTSLKISEMLWYMRTTQEWRNKSSCSENAVFPPLGDASQFGMNYCQIFLFNHNKPWPANKRSGQFIYKLS